MKKKLVEQILIDLSIPKNSSAFKLFRDAILWCSKMNIVLADINLSRDIFPYLERRSSLTQAAIDSRMGRAAKRRREKYVAIEPYIKANTTLDILKHCLTVLNIRLKSAE